MNPGKVIDPIAVYQPDENLRLGAGYAPKQARNLLPLPRRSRLPRRSHSALRRRRRLPQSRRRHHVPQLHGHPRGAALHPRPRPPALGNAAKATSSPTDWHNEERPRSPRPLPLLQSLQNRVPRQRRHGHLQGRIPRPLLRRPPPPRSITTPSASWIASPTPPRSSPASPRVSPICRSHLPGLIRTRSKPSLASRSHAGCRNSRRALSNMNGEPRNRIVPPHTPREAPPPGRLVLWPDTWNNYYHPQSLHAATRVLAQAGFTLEVPRQHVCCGRPLYDFGMLKQARQYLLHILNHSPRKSTPALPFVFLEPSCATVFRDELVNFFPHDARAQASRRPDPPAQRIPRPPRPQLPARRSIPAAKSSSTATAITNPLMKMTDEIAILRRTGADVELLDSGCCGMAGPFGFEHDKFAVSQTLGERVLLPAVRAAAPATILVSRRLQLPRADRAKHHPPRRPLRGSHRRRQLTRPQPAS